VVEFQLCSKAVIDSHETAAGLGGDSSPTVPTSVETRWERQAAGDTRFSTVSTFPTLERVSPSNTQLRVDQMGARGAWGGRLADKPLFFFRWEKWERWEMLAALGFARPTLMSQMWKSGNFSGKRYALPRGGRACPE
jgi:hypothetical protein